MSKPGEHGSKMVQARWGSVSVTGNYRENNEDRCLADPQGRYFLVADGMGGQSAGEKASELAVEVIAKRLDQTLNFEQARPDDVVRGIDKAVSHANLEIMALGEVDRRFHKMGTTIVFLVRAGGKVYVGGVGDSRVYRLRNDTLEQLTTDHTIAQALVDAGTIRPDELSTHRYRNMLYRYLGDKEGSAGTAAQTLDPKPGDRFLLCSDGATEGLDEDELVPLIKQHDDPQQASQAIVDAALAGGSRDNITALLVYFD